MSITIEDYILPKTIPTASTELLILPWNTSKETKTHGKAVYPESASTILKLLREKSIGIELAEGCISDVMLEDRRSLEWLGPIIFFSMDAISQNTAIVSVTLNIISNYLSNVLFGDSVSRCEPVAKLEIVIQDKDSTKKAKYDGPISGLSEVAKAIEAIKE